MTKIEFKNAVEKFVANNHASSINEITEALHSMNKKQTHYQCMSKVVDIVYDLVNKNEIVENSNSAIPLFSIIQSTK